MNKEKVSDKALSRSIIASVTGILLCMACLFGTTWAWYTSTLTSGENEVSGANFDIDVLFENPVVPDEDGIYTLTENENKVKLTNIGTAEKGYCQIIAKKDGETFATSYYIELTGIETAVDITVKGKGTMKFTPLICKPVGNLTDPSAGISLAIESEPEAVKEPVETDNGKAPQETETEPQETKDAEGTDNTENPQENEPNNEIEQDGNS